ncbi:MAG: DUF1009 domain-containing protein [Alphaproteobacteria bacterium CG_4_10_14_0_8_um_filter_53_9]|nr:MAG: DUF1009 domain-containing protein [Alphaproteobacteria bacterium CG_4_10_14_0_8_um_filter_53_9]
MTTPILTLLAGGGTLPAIMAHAALAKGWKVNIITFAGQPQPLNMPDGLMQKRLPLTKVGQVLDHLKSVKATHVALAGYLHKPSLIGSVPDAEGVKLLAGLGLKRLGGGDDALLRAVTARLTAAGLTLVTTTDLAGGLIVPAGTLTKRAPTLAEKKDIELGTQVLKALSAHDIGQACVVAHGVVLGVEGVEGTDALIDRCAMLRGSLKPRERAGILVKRAKDGQIDAADMPAIGPRTLAKLAEDNFVGVAIQADKTLILEKEKTLHTANAAHLFIHAE